VSHGSTERFSLRVTPAVRRALTQRLPEPVAFAAFEFINGPLLDNPYRVGRRLLPPLDDRHTARRGSYRIIYRIDDKARTVTVVR
jgi:mRNA interferase RelE/StbE